MKERLKKFVWHVEKKKNWNAFLFDVCNAKLNVSKTKEAMKMMFVYHKGQRRLSGLPYVVHPLDVAHKYAKLFGKDEGIIVALLHDVLEDGPKNTGKGRDEILSEIKKIFGWNIAKKILALTNVEGEKYGEGLRKYLLEEGDLIPFKVKFCDVWSNVEDIGYVTNPEKKRRIAMKYLNLFNQFECIFSTFPNYKAIKALILQEIR
jgi:(p)ppGpp synthase/HD superfamily hydrolase